MKLKTAAAIFLAVLPAFSGSDALPRQLRNIGIDQRLNARLPLDAGFRDERGAAVKLGDYFTDKPVILALVYFDCPMLCTLELNGLLRALKAVPLDAGRDFKVVAVSFDPQDTPAKAAAKKASYVKSYHRPGAEQGWHFLTGEPPAIGRLTEAAGFRYGWDEKARQFVHATAVMVATPGGRLARYFYGVEYSPRDLRLGLVDASSGRIGTPVDQFLLFCYHYDPSTGRYTTAVMGVIRGAGLLVLASLAGFILTMLWRDRKKKIRLGGSRV